MKVIGNIIGAIGILVFLNAIIGRFIDGPGVMGWLPFGQGSLAASQVIPVATCIIVIGILCILNEKK